jgi:hypothetical protein
VYANGPRRQTNPGARGRPVVSAPIARRSDGVRQRANETVYPSIGQFDGESALIAIPFQGRATRRVAISFDGVPAPPPWLTDPYVLRLELPRR